MLPNQVLTDEQISWVVLNVMQALGIIGGTALLMLAMGWIVVRVNTSRNASQIINEELKIKDLSSRQRSSDPDSVGSWSYEASADSSNDLSGKS